jgi:hypothetical protein
VLDDAHLVTWDAYAARAWPTLVLVDPRGYVVAQVSGEEEWAIEVEVVPDGPSVLRLELPAGG